ncbi:isopentenyl-diphosphate Delta-isomerase [Reichenbachiella sp. MALMAid0571]|uniref:isopentenyl-diphosphate Delta-isomerase n=1 Tax=Reichenbachiella sp. MALMAid0571 TaxID=3143939 RepID=UPI0032E04C06
MEKVILVNNKDVETGSMEKLEAHKSGLLHRAISVFIFNDQNELLLQKRALNKYHSAGLWTNTCCSHPRAGEDTKAAASRRLQEEMGLNTDLKWCFSFHYKAELENGLTENELDHVFIGKHNEAPIPNAEEVSEWKYINLDVLKSDINSNPEDYTFWFKLILDRVATQYLEKAY